MDIWTVRAKPTGSPRYEALAESIRLNNYDEFIRLQKSDSCLNLAKKKVTLLDHAIRCDRPVYVQFIIMRGADVNRPGPSPEGITPLLLATMGGQTEIVRMLIAAHVNLDVCDRYGKAPILIAAQHHYFDIVTMLVEAGANINAVEAANDHTALTYAACAGALDIVAFLLDHGARQDITSAKDHKRVKFCEYRLHPHPETFIPARQYPEYLRTHGTNSER